MAVGRQAECLAPSGFTLVELLIASTMAAVLFGGLGAHLRGGLVVWERATTTADTLQRRRVALDRLERELANSLVYDPREDAYGEAMGQLPQPAFSSDGLAWFTAAPAGAAGLPAIRFVTYQCERHDGRAGLWRTSQRLGEARARKATQPQLALPGCEALRVRYAYDPPDPSGPLLWKTEWPDGFKLLPRLVEVTLTLDTGEAVRRTVLVPAGRFKTAG